VWDRLWSRGVNSSWRVDETYIRVRNKWYYLYRAVDKYGKTVDFLLRPDRGTADAQAFFRKALARSLPRWPRKVTLDGYRSSHQALRLLQREDPKWKYVLVGSNQYLNNIVEQRPPRNQTPMFLDDRLQVSSECSYHDQWN
jgi:transposase-like protein